ncbi:acyltransferase [Actinoplanes sp. NPDC049316]|uniref:acyltransferase n=1 Tax=Actinoplanes sp. NPDC049316 TaxID=3154727 RepID=UPI0034126CA2
MTGPERAGGWLPGGLGSSAAPAWEGSSATAWDDDATQVITAVKEKPAPAAEAPTVPAAKPRAGWADVAKGVCILLVVMWHVIMKHYLQIDWHLPAPIPGLWGTFGDQLLPLRMPVFFTISGLFAAAAVQRSWKVTARSRIAKFYYLYVVWFVVHTTVLAMVPSFETLAAHSALDVLEQVTITPTNLWYLVALAVYFVVAKLSRNLPVAAVLVPAFLLSATASAGLLAAPGNRGQLYQNLFFFLAGLRLKPWVERWARTANLRMLLVGGAGYLVVMLALRQLGAKQWFGVWPVVSAMAVVVGVAAAVQLERLTRVGDLLAKLGRNTLPIYVMHMPLLALMHAALLRPFSSASTPIQIMLALFLPLVLTGLLAGVCLTLNGWIRSAGGTWLFDLPSAKKSSEPAKPVTPVAEPVEPSPEPMWDEQPTMVLPQAR